MTTIMCILAALTISPGFILLIPVAIVADIVGSIFLD